MSGNCRECGNRAELNEDNLCQNCQLRANQQKILEWINDDFSLSIDHTKNLINPSDYDENGDILSFGVTNIENFEMIFQAIKNYMANHSQQFRLGDDTMNESPHLNDGDQPQWWSRPMLTADYQRIPGTNLITSILQGSNGRSRTRKIFHESGNSLHPSSFTEEQYEELKNLIPNSCKIRGCYMTYADPYEWGAMTVNTYTAINGICLYHQAMGETYNGGEETNNNNPSNQDNGGYNEEEVIEYNIKLIELRSKLEEEKEEIIFQGQEKLALLMSLEKENEVGVRENLDIINDENQPTLNLREKFEDPARHADNQQREIQNETQINSYKNWLARKKEAVKKLEVIINQINQQKPTNETPEPTQQSPKSEGEKKENPVAENNKKSNENIEELSHLSLTEAKSKAKEEINNLLERYGVKSSELDTKIWEGTESWEKYLKSLSDNEKVEKFVKKIKAFIIQQNNKNKQRLSKLSLEEVKQECKSQIKELLQKYSGVNPKSLDKKLWNNEENWEKY